MTIKAVSGVVQNTATTGTGTISLGSAVSGFFTFAEVENLSSGDKVFYAIEEGTNREVGVGTYTSGSPDTLSRDTIVESTNNDDPISLGGNAVVFASVPGNYLRTLDENGNLDLQAAKAVDVADPTNDSDAATKGWVETNWAVQAKATNYTVVESDFGDIINVDASGGALTINVPDASVVGNGFHVGVRKTDSSANNVLITREDLATFEGETSLTLQKQYEHVILRTDGSNWIVESGLTARVDRSPTFRNNVTVGGNSTVSGTGSYGGRLTINEALDASKGSDIASASTIDLDSATGNFVEVTGNTNISGVTLSEGVERVVRFTGSLTLVHGASLQLPNAGIDIDTSPGDIAVFRGGAGGNAVYVTNYQRADGDSVAGAGNVAQSQAAALDLLGIFS